MMTKAMLSDADWVEIETIQEKIRTAKGQFWVRYTDGCGVVSGRMAVRIYLARLNKTALACWSL